MELTGPDSSRLLDTLKKFAEQTSSVGGVCQWGAKEAPAALCDAVLAAGQGQGLRALQLSAQQFCSKLTDIGFYLGSYPRVKFVVIIEGDDSSLVPLNQALQAVKSGQDLPNAPVPLSLLLLHLAAVTKLCHSVTCALTFAGSPSAGWPTNALIIPTGM